MKLVAKRRAQLVDALEQRLAGMSHGDRKRLVALLAELNDVLDPHLRVDAPAAAFRRARR